MADIQYVGINDLEDIHKAHLSKFSEEYYSRIQRKLHQDIRLRVHIKTFNKGGERIKYSVHINVMGPVKVFESSAHGWDFDKVMHQSFREMEKQIDHSFHHDVTDRKVDKKGAVQRFREFMRV